MLIPYIRQSRKKEVTISLESQRDAIQAWAASAGVTLGTEVIEQGVSGKKPWRTRELGAVIEAVERGEANGVVVAFQDRLSREQNLATAEVWEALAAAKARLVCAAEGLDVTAGGGPDDEMLFTIKAAVARHQWRRYQANWAKATEHAVAGGKYQGLTPVGYDRLEDGRLRKNADAERVAEAFAVRAGGGSWSEVCRSLMGVETPTSRHAREKDPSLEPETRWGVNSARSLVSNPIFKGLLKNGHDHHFAEYAIVTPSLWDRVNPARPSPGRPGRKDGGKWALLGGMIFCRGCDHRLAPTTTTAHGNQHRYYQCKSIKCDSRATVRVDEVEAYVLSEAADYFEAAVESGGVGTGRDTDVEKVAALEEAVADAQRRRDKALLASGVADEVLVALEVEVEAAKSALTDETGASRVEVTPDEFRAMLAAADLDERKMLVRKTVERVTVTRGKGTVEERADVTFRALVW